MTPTIHPLIEVAPSSQRALRRIGFRFTDVHLGLTPDGWLRLSVDWTAKVGSYRVKYPEEGGHSYGSGGGREHQSVELEFPQVYAPYHYGAGEAFQPNHYAEQNKATIEVGVLIKTGRRLNPPRLPYGLQFIEKTKYGVCVWFSPRKWNAKPLKWLYWWRGSEKP